ncbi:MAG: DUF2892 domain-containing protein [Anaerolineae bacterium]|jgi:uncharacterized membrane protein|nr:DUF2892 domain-containing protein [Anaerolineae bacterium]
MINEFNGTSSNSSPVNVGPDERTISLVAGVVLILLGLAKRNLWSLPAIALGTKMLYRGATGHSPIYSLLKLNTAVSTHPEAVSVPHQQGVHVVKAITIQRSIEDLYQYWRNLENLPHIMGHLESVKVIDVQRSHWVAKAPAGLSVEWDAEIVNDIPNEVIAWRSVENAQIANAGSVRFKPAPNNRGVEVKVTLEYVPPAGNIGVAIAKLFGEEPAQQTADGLRRFKQVMEVGEVTTIEGQSSGRK